MKFEL